MVNPRPAGGKRCTLFPEICPSRPKGPSATVTWCDGRAEVSRGHSSRPWRRRAESNKANENKPHGQEENEKRNPQAAGPRLGGRRLVSGGGRRSGMPSERGARFPRARGGMQTRRHGNPVEEVTERLKPRGAIKGTPRGVRGGGQPPPTRLFSARPLQGAWDKDMERGRFLRHSEGNTRKRKKYI